MTKEILCGGVGVGELETQNAYFIWLTLCYVEDMHELWLRILSAMQKNCRFLIEIQTNFTPLNCIGPGL